MGPGVLRNVLSGLPRTADPNLLVGFDASDDAAVYRVSPEVALIQTVDFFPPVVDDPYDFGRVAAANALSDVYAMGGEPRLAMNLLAIPSCLGAEVAGAILAGGAEKAAEAGAVIAGGHSIEDREPKYGLCVTGFAHPDRILTNTGAREGDLLILTKPLGSGVLTTAAKAGLLDEAACRAMVEVMAALNRAAWAAMVTVSPHACTDITGFGFLGHLKEMAQGSGVSAEIWAERVPLQPGALALARDGILPAGAYRNRDFVGGDAVLDSAVPLEVTDLLFDPQTSGGLLISVPEERGAVLLDRLRDGGVAAAAVGRVLAAGGPLIRVK